MQVRIFENVLKVWAAVAGFVAGLYGGWSESMRVLVIFMAVDYALGLMCALTGKSPKTETGHFLSQVAFMGLLKKAVIMLVVLLAVQLDRALGIGGAGGDQRRMFQTAAVFFYIANEGLSILENAGLLGVPIPKPIKNALEALRERSEEAPEELPRAAAHQDMEMVSGPEIRRHQAQAEAGEAAAELRKDMSEELYEDSRELYEGSRELYEGEDLPEGEDAPEDDSPVG